MLSEFRNLCGRGQEGHVATPLKEEVGESILVQVHGSSDFCTGWYKNRHGLYESSYCYHIIYVITCNLNAPELS